MKPALTITPITAVGQYRVCDLIEVTSMESKGEREYRPGYVMFEGSLDQCAQYVMDQAHHAGYMEAAKKAINAISDAL